MKTYLSSMKTWKNNCIDENIFNQIKSIILKLIINNKYKVFLYWWRVDWKCHKHSDYDIWISWKKSLDSVTKYNLELEFENIPSIIEITDFSNVDEEFKKLAMKKIIYFN